jgi:hypothetical protein
MVTEERDRLKNVVNELKRPKNDQGGDEAASGVLLQVLELNSSSIFLCTLLFMSRNLNHLLHRRNFVLKNWRVIYMHRKKSIVANWKK